MTKPKSARQPAVKKTTTALVASAQKISEADRTKAESLLAEIARRKERIAEDFYDIGVALSVLAKKKLYLALGHSSFDEMLQKRNIMNASTARGLIQLATTMKRDEALAYGQEKAIALLGYASATPEPDTPKTLMDGGKLPDGKPIAEASVRDLKQAATRVRAAQGKARPASEGEKAAKAEAKAFGQWLHTRGIKGAKITPARVKGGHVIKVEIPVAAAAKLRGG